MIPLVMAVAWPSCSGAQTNEPATRGSHPRTLSLSTVRSLSSPRIEGRVTLSEQSEQPVKEFAVFVTPDSALAHLQPPFVVKDSGGRFSVHTKPGTWDVVIVGSGFSRYVAKGVSVESGAKTRPLVVRVKRGQTFAGRVVDSDAPAKCPFRESANRIAAFVPG